MRIKWELAKPGIPGRWPLKYITSAAAAADAGWMRVTQATVSKLLIIVAVQY